MEELPNGEIFEALRRNFIILSLDGVKRHLRKPLDTGDEMFRVHVILDDVLKMRHLVLENFRFTSDGVLSNYHQGLDICQLSGCYNLLKMVKDLFVLTDAVEGKTRIKALVIQDEHYQDHFEFYESLVEFVKTTPQLKSIDINCEDFSDRSKFVKLLASGTASNQVVNFKITICRLLKEREA